MEVTDAEGRLLRLFPLDGMAERAARAALALTPAGRETEAQQAVPLQITSTHDGTPTYRETGIDITDAAEREGQDA